ncbi:MAG: chemotaxis protein CheC, partial [SAR202 cluster bacterium]|nr:chemotaxis protein CheC [SAR202 cluster bacterium]
MSTTLLPPEQSDALQGVLNIGKGRASGMLNDLVEAHVTLQVPEVRLITPPEIEENIDRLGWNDIAGVKMKFCGA